MRNTSNASSRGLANFLRDAADTALTGSRKLKWDSVFTSRTNGRFTGMSVKMEGPVEIRPAVNVPGFMLRCGHLALWFAADIHAIQYAQDVYRERDIVVFNPDGTVKFRYSEEKPR